MRGKHVAILAVLVAAVLIAVFYLQRPAGESASDRHVLIPGLDAELNDVTQVRLTKAGNETIATIKTTERGWSVTERSDYPAHSGKIRKLLIDLSKAEVLEQKTSNPDLYGRLGVDDVSSEDATGVQIDIEGLAEPVKLIVGDTATSLVATYVRPAGEDTSLMVSGQIEPGMQTADWLDTQLIDIPGDRVQSVTVTRPDGDNIVAKKSARGEDMEVQNVPAGRELSSPTAASTLATALSGLTLKDVIARSSLAAEAGAGVSTAFRTFDGLVLTATSFKIGDKHYVAVDAAFDEEQAKQFYMPPEDETSEEAAGADNPDGGDEAPDAGENARDEATEQSDPSVFHQAREEAERLESRLNDWAFEIPEYKYNNLTKPLSSLLADDA